MRTRLEDLSRYISALFYSTLGRAKEMRRGFPESDFKMNERGKMQHVRNEDRCPCNAPAKPTGDKGREINSPTMPCIAVKSRDLFTHPLGQFSAQARHSERCGGATSESQSCKGPSL